MSMFLEVVGKIETLCTKIDNNFCFLTKILKIQMLGILKKKFSLAFKNTSGSICYIFNLYIISLELCIYKTDVTTDGSKQCIFFYN